MYVVMEPAEQEFFSEEDYLEKERHSDTKHEYREGRIVAMAGGSPRHNLITSNITGTLRVALKGRLCLVFSSDQRLFAPLTGIQHSPMLRRAARKLGKAPTSLYTYADVSVVCGRPEYHPKDRDTLVNPVLIVEVLSSSTATYDRTSKFARYRNLPSLSEYLLVEQSDKLVEHFRRGAGAEWLLKDYRDESAVIHLPSLGIELPVAEIYDKVDLLDEADELGGAEQ